MEAVIFGILSATYPAFQLIGAPILGRWSDNYGRKKILLLSNAGTLVGWILFLVALFLTKENIFSINSVLLGTFVMTPPLLVLFFARAIEWERNVIIRVKRRMTAVSFGTFCLITVNILVDVGYPFDI